MYQIDLFRVSAFLSLPAWGISRALGHGARRGPARIPQRKCGPRPRTVGRSLGLQSRGFWPITKWRLSELTRLDTALRLPSKTYRTTVFSSALIVMIRFFHAA